MMLETKYVGDMFEITVQRSQSFHKQKDFFSSKSLNNSICQLVVLVLSGKIDSNPTDSVIYLFVLFLGGMTRLDFGTFFLKGAFDSAKCIFVSAFVMFVMQYILTGS